MFVFSSVHRCDGLTDTAQLLVFTSDKARDLFAQRYSKKVQTFPEEARYYDKGAFLVMRAVKVLKAPVGSNNGFSPVIRCGFTGELIWIGTDQYTVKLALFECVKQLYCDHPELVIDKLFHEQILTPYDENFVLRLLNNIKVKILR